MENKKKYKIFSLKALFSYKSNLKIFYIHLQFKFVIEYI